MTLNPNITIIENLYRYVVSDPDRVACQFWTPKTEFKPITRSVLWTRSQSFATHLRNEGAIEGQTLVIVLSQQPEILYAFLGAMMIGMIPTIMPFPTAKQNPDIFWDGHRELFEMIGPAQFLTFKDNRELVDVVPPASAIRFLEEIDDWFNDGKLDPPIKSNIDIALLQHTSGTTGLKKGVMLTHNAIITQVAAYSAEIGFCEHDIIASWLPLYHDMGLIACFLLPMLKGAKFVLLDPFAWVLKPQTLLDCVEAQKATFCWLPNFAFLHLVRTAPRGRCWDLSSIKAIINCSEPCKPASFEKFYERFAEGGLRPSAFQICYAMAENVFAVTQTDVDSTPRTIEVDADALETNNKIEFPRSARAVSLLSCGKPIAGSMVTIWADGVMLGPRQIGEVAITSDCLFDGYNKLPHVTAAKKKNGRYFTGDLGFIDDGELFVTGRTDDLMIVYGRNFYAHNIEQAASDCLGVVPGRVVAFTVENDVSGSRDAILLVEGDGSDPEVELRRRIKGRILDMLGLSLHSVHICARGSLIKSTAGKISRHHNKQLFLERVEAI